MVVPLIPRAIPKSLSDTSNRYSIGVYLPNDLLVKVDIASTAVGLEARSPMVDHEFIEFVALLRSSLQN